LTSSLRETDGAVSRAADISLSFLEILSDYAAIALLFQYPGESSFAARLDKIAADRVKLHPTSKIWWNPPPQNRRAPR